MTDQPSDTTDNTTAAVNPADFIEETLPDNELLAEPASELAEVESKPKEETVSAEQPAKPKKQIIQQKAIVSEDCFTPDPTAVGNPEAIPMPAAFLDEIDDSFSSLQSMNIPNTPSSERWGTVLKEGVDFASYDEMYRKTVEDQSALFEQKTTVNGQDLKASHPKFSNDGVDALQGDRAVFRVRSFLGLGTMFRVPLWNSGFWITFKAPSEGDLLELQRQVISDKITLGRSTFGLAFSNVTSYTTDRLLNFAMAHVYQCSLKTGKDIREFISCQDIPTVLWGIANTIWPHGFPYSRSCIADPEKCQHVVEERLNLSKILWTNNATLTPWQLSHMTNMRNGSMDEDSVKRYKSEMLRAQNKMVVIKAKNGNEIQVMLKVPTANEFIDSGNRWIGGLSDTVNKTLGINASIDERNNYMLDQGRANAMRQYTHWVAGFLFSGSNIEDRETIEETLNVLSTDDDLRNGFMACIDEYINSTTVSVIGIPDFTCPNCGKGQKDPAEENPTDKFRNIIPIDIYNTFFTLLVQRLEKIKLR